MYLEKSEINCSPTSLQPYDQSNKEQSLHLSFLFKMISHHSRATSTNQNDEIFSAQMAFHTKLQLLHFWFWTINTFRINQATIQEAQQDEQRNVNRAASDQLAFHSKLQLLHVWTNIKFRFHEDILKRWAMQGFTRIQAHEHRLDVITPLLMRSS